LRLTHTSPIDKSCNLTRSGLVGCCEANIVGKQKLEEDVNLTQGFQTEDAKDKIAEDHSLTLCDQRRTRRVAVTNEGPIGSPSWVMNVRFPKHIKYEINSLERALRSFYRPLEGFSRDPPLATISAEKQNPSVLDAVIIGCRQSDL
jgi:hypothetical protein